MTDATTVDAEKYSAWFAWARDALHRGLDETHAAAEAAYYVREAGGTSEEGREAAEKAGEEPSAQLDAETMAIAEWAAWALSTHGAGPDESVAVARQAVARVQETHDLAAATRDAVAALTALRRPEPAKPRGNRSGWIVGGVVAAVVVLSIAVAGVMNATTYKGPDNSYEPAKPTPSMTVSIDPSSDRVTLAVVGLPPNFPVYVFVGDKWVDSVETDGSGAMSTTIEMPRGGDTVYVCLDNGKLSCPVSAFVTH